MCFSETETSSIRRTRPSARNRSEEHTSELQSQSNLVCRLLLEKKKCCHPILLISLFPFLKLFFFLFFSSLYEPLFTFGQGSTLTGLSGCSAYSTTWCPACYSTI